MTGPAEPHPSWCAPERCEVAIGNGHSSVPIVIRPDSDSPARVAVRIWQAVDAPWSTDRTPRVEVITGEHGSGVRHRADLSLAQTRGLRIALDTLVALAAGVPVGPAALPAPPEAPEMIGRRW